MPSLLRVCVVATATVALFVQYRLERTGVSPVSLPLPDLPEFPTSTIRNMKVEIIGRNELVGPESLVASNGYMFATLGDGQIARLSHADDDGQVKWTFIARTGSNSKECGFSPADEADTEEQCGRPLGLKVVKRSTVDLSCSQEEDEDVLIVADAYKGLLMLSNIYAEDEARITTLATRANTDPPEYQFRLLNALIQAPDGSIYISETSQEFRRRRIFYAAFDGRASGRLLRYTKEGGVEVVVQGLYMPNGLALSHDERSILVVSGVSILLFSLTETAALKLPHLVPVLPGTGDNLDAMDHLPSGEPRHCYWAGLGSKYARPFSLLQLVSDKVWLRSILVALIPYKVLVNLIPKLSALAVYDEQGELIEVYRDNSAVFPWVSEGESFDGYLYLGSWFNPFLARVKMGT